MKKVDSVNLQRTFATTLLLLLHSHILRTKYRVFIYFPIVLFCCPETGCMPLKRHTAAATANSSSNLHVVYGTLLAASLYNVHHTRCIHKLYCTSKVTSIFLRTLSQPISIHYSYSDNMHEYYSVLTTLAWYFALRTRHFVRSTSTKYITSNTLCMYFRWFFERQTKFLTTSIYSDSHFPSSYLMFFF